MTYFTLRHIASTHSPHCRGFSFDQLTGEKGQARLIDKLALYVDPSWKCTVAINSTAPFRGALRVSNVEKSSQYCSIRWSQLFLHLCGGNKWLEVRINKNLYKSDLLAELGTGRRKIERSWKRRCRGEACASVYGSRDEVWVSFHLMIMPSREHSPRRRH